MIKVGFWFTSLLLICASDPFKVKGFQVAPAELEGHLLLHPAVKDACVIGLPHEFCGEVPLAYIVTQPDLQETLAHNLEEQVRLKESIAKVCELYIYYVSDTNGNQSMSLMQKSITNG